MGVLRKLGTLSIPLLAHADCQSASDVATTCNSFDSLQRDVQGCAVRCIVSGNPCMESCVQSLGFSESCAPCWVSLASCSKRECAWDCLNPTSNNCTKCAKQRCFPALLACSGFACDQMPGCEADSAKTNLPGCRGSSRFGRVRRLFPIQPPTITATRPCRKPPPPPPSAAPPPPLLTPPLFPIQRLAGPVVLTNPALVRLLPRTDWPPVARALGPLLSRPVDVSASLSRAAGCVRDLPPRAGPCNATQYEQPPDEWLVAWHAYLDAITEATASDNQLLLELLAAANASIDPARVQLWSLGDAITNATAAAERAAVIAVAAADGIPDTEHITRRLFAANPPADIGAAWIGYKTALVEAGVLLFARPRSVSSPCAGRTRALDDVGRANIRWAHVSHAGVALGKPAEIWRSATANKSDLLDFGPIKMVDAGGPGAAGGCEDVGVSSEWHHRYILWNRGFVLTDGCNANACHCAPLVSKLSIPGVACHARGWARRRAISLWWVLLLQDEKYDHMLCDRSAPLLMCDEDLHDG